MVTSQQITEAIKPAGQWLTKIRREHGGWGDMVYKQQGIVNTVEAWRSLWQCGEVHRDIKWDKQWLTADLGQLAKEVETRGFIRSPYCPTDRPHESIDATAFVLLMLSAVSDKHNGIATRPLSKLFDLAKNDLVENQSESGGWSWGAIQDGRPLYPYFTYMAIKALRATNEKAKEKGVKWLVSVQKPDGSFAVHTQSSESDIASTAYAAITLSTENDKKARSAFLLSIRYLLSVPLSNLTQVGYLKIVEPKRAPQLSVSYENYAVAANVVLALLNAQSESKKIPQAYDRLHFLVQHLLDQQAPSGGWPATYSTIYVTHTVISALAAFLLWQERQPKINPVSEHENPYIFGFPIQHPQMFFGRESILKRIRIEIGTAFGVKRDFALMGPSGVGKTSLLYQLRQLLAQDGHAVFYIDLALMQSVEQFLQTFIGTLGHAVFNTPCPGDLKDLFTRAYHRLDRKLFDELSVELQMPFLQATATRSNTQSMFEAFLSDIQKLIQRFEKLRREPGAKVICLLDEIPALDNLFSPSLYNFLRGIAQQMSELVLIVTDTPEKYRKNTQVSKSFYSIFTPIHIGPLSRKAAVSLITDPVKGQISYTLEAIELLLSVSKRKPNILSELCYHAIRLLPKSRKQVDKPLVRQAQKELRNSQIGSD